MVLELRRYAKRDIRRERRFDEDIRIGRQTGNKRHADIDR